MIVFAREVFVCKCSTDVRAAIAAMDAERAGLGDLAMRMSFVKGGERELERLDPAHHDPAHVAELRERLARGEHWMVGVEGPPGVSGAGATGGRIVTYTWLHTRSRVDYPYLPGCSFEVASDVGYGYDAWTPPDLRGGGLRRRAFLEELRVLSKMGARWEASYFVKHQLEGAQRSLAKAGIDVVPLWRVKLERDKSLSVENLAPGDASTKPAFAQKSLDR